MLDQIILVILSFNIFSLIAVMLLFWRFSAEKEQRSERILKEASQALISALKQKPKTAGFGKLELAKFEADYSAELKQLATELRQRLLERAKIADADYDQFVKSLQKLIDKNVREQQKTLTQRSGEFFTKTEKVLDEFITSIQEQTKSEVEKELLETREAIDEYRRHALRMVDENLVAILEKTLNIALGKKLTLSDQIELIYEALEQAKKERFFK